MSSEKFVHDKFVNDVFSYIDKTRFAVLAYVRHDGTPLLRSIGSFVPNGLSLYFTTRKDAAKVKEISDRKRISFFFEHEGQELSAWKNLLLVGDAVKIDSGSDFDDAVQLLSARNPRFKDRVAKGELPSTQIFRLNTEEIEFLDYGKGIGHVEKVTLKKAESL
ncbi:MAG: pyridoxamine 5'-phosphate oxidase family protein [Desulfuromonadaceae bacterium]